MKVYFRFDDVFPAEDTVSQFLVGLCMAINDVTLSIKLQGALLEQGTEGESSYSLYLMCAYYREAAKFLDDWLEKGTGFRLPGRSVPRRPSPPR